ncbi:MAG TPA: hypothetical protein VFN92_10685 [Solirubrobacterales bacterium]|nr:hypothetical protein [Solirubrobacterales bacterium]
MPASRDELLRSLERQKLLLSESIVLTPVDSLPFGLADRDRTSFLHGLYLTDKVRDKAARMDAVVQFGGREQTAEDLAAIHRLFAHAFGASTGSLRLLSGLQAHAATFMSISAIGQTVMLLSEEAGGHFSTRAIFERLGLRTLDLPIDPERMCIDRAATEELVERERPEFVFVDRSEGLRYEDFSFIGRLEGTTTVFDASQFVTPILTGRYENPLAWGFDLMLFTLHKNFPGPQKAAILGREEGDLWKRLVAGLSTMVSSSHAENTYLAGLTLLREEWLERYVQRLLGTAAGLEAALAQRGVQVLPRSRQGDPRWPVTHHIWVLAEDREAAFAQYEGLTSVRIHTNYRKLPYGLGYGLRLGTSFSSVAGIGDAHLEELADIVATTIASGPSASLQERVGRLAAEARTSAILPAEYWT